MVMNSFAPKTYKKGSSVKESFFCSGYCQWRYLNQLWNKEQMYFVGSIYLFMSSGPANDSNNVTLFPGLTLVTKCLKPSPLNQGLPFPPLLCSVVQSLNQQLRRIEWGCLRPAPQSWHKGKFCCYSQQFLHSVLPPEFPQATSSQLLKPEACAETAWSGRWDRPFIWV